ncbi:hypothetical protein Mapa_013976 [Marchantia paleacea]|nr:hypothetical protein Mapa_013976 [Marchantia paleacea]
MVIVANQAAEAVQLKEIWRDKYKSLTRDFLNLSKQGKTFSLCIVGRAGVGKGSLLNHLVLRPQAPVSHTLSGAAGVERIYTVGNFRISDIPSYDGKHAIATQYKSWFECASTVRCGANKKSNKDAEKRPEGYLSLRQFVEAYRLFEKETNGVIFVVNNRITNEDKELMIMACEARKFFFVVRTYADPVARIRDPFRQMERMDEMEDEIRTELGLTKDLNTRIFKISIPWPEVRDVKKELEGSDRDDVEENMKLLDFPVLKVYLTEAKGLFGEIHIHDIVQDEVWSVLSQYQTVRTWYRLLDFSENVVIGTLVPVVGPVCLTFIKTLIYIIKGCSDIGLVVEPERAVQKLVAETKGTKLVTNSASKEGLVSTVQDVLADIFGRVLYDLAIDDLVQIAADASLSETIPLLGPFVSAATLPKRYRFLTEVLAHKACMLHELWIRQNITKVLQIQSPLHPMSKLQSPKQSLTCTVQAACQPISFESKYPARPKSTIPSRMQSPTHRMSIIQSPAHPMFSIKSPNHPSERQHALGARS